MAETIPFEKVQSACVRIVESLEKNRDYLNDLDAPIGDSDHGESVCNAFRKAKEAVDALPEGERDIGALLQSVGKSIIFSGGAAMGPLYGTAFMDAGLAVGGKSELNLEDLVPMWEAFAAGIERRGKVQPGEKTMYDTVYPVAGAVKEAVEKGSTLSEIAKAAVEAAQEGMESTKDMLSRRGRSSRLGERSIGHIDPGAASSFFIIRAFFESIA